MITNQTMQFKEIFPDVEVFITSLETLFPYIRSELIITSIDYNILFPALQAEYATQEILYDTSEAFKRHFLKDYFTWRPKIVREIELSQTINATKAGDILESSRQYNVASFNNSTILNKPVEEINPYVDAQQVEARRINTFDANLRLLDKALDRMIYNFVLDFAPHFKSISSNYEYFYFWR